ncbi:MAG: LamG domain-containing protein [Chitinophagales bacterium]
MTNSIFRFRSLAIAVLCSMFFSLVLLSCKKDEVLIILVNRSCLTENVTAADALYYGTDEGTIPGQYVIGSKADLKTALDAALLVLADSSSTSADVTNACAQLEAAIAAYQANINQEILPENLIGFWKLDGNPADSSGHGNNGVVTTGHAFFGAGIPMAIPDRFGRANMAYHFDKGGNIEVPYTSSLNPAQMTISLWCKKDTAGRTVNKDTYTLLSLNRWNGYKYQWQSTNRPFYTVHAVNGSDTVYYDKDDNLSLDNEIWYHIAVSFTSGQEVFYVNGLKVQTWTDVPGIPVMVPSTVNFVIGQDLPTSYYLTVDPTGNRLVDYGGFWTGDMDDVMFYNTVLSDQQVSSIYESQKNP